MSQKTEQEIIKDKKNLYFDQINPMIDYFAEFGISPHQMSKNFFFESEIEDFNEKIQCELITKFPNFDKKRICFDQSLVSHIFPKKFEAIKTSEKPPKKFFNVILDNQFYSSKYTQKYISCLLFYESREDYQNCYCDYLLLKPENQSAKKQNELNTKKGKIAEIKYKNLAQIYIPKCICFISVHPYFNYFKEMLDTIHKASESSSEILFDKIIEKLVIETFDPPRGKIKLQLDLLSTTIKFEQSKMNDLPLVNFDLEFIFKNFQYDKLIEIFKFVLFEKKIVFMSDDISKPALAIMGFITLLTPLKYQYTIISNLPKESYGMLNNETPFLFGINESYSQNFLTDNGIKITNNEIIMVDVDGGVYKIENTDNNKLEEKKSFLELLKLEDKDKKEDLRKSEREILHDFPQKLKSQIESAIKPRHFKKEIKYREEFFNFMCSLLEPYQKIFSSNITSTINSVEYALMLNKKEMKDLRKDKEFYLQFFNTKTFNDFLSKKITPKDDYDKLEILYVDEMLKRNNKRSNKNEVFLSSKKYEFDKETKKVEIKASKLSESDKEFFKIKENRHKAFLRGIKCELNDKSGKSKFSFRHDFFPSLLSDKLFEKNIENFSVLDTRELLKEENELIAQSSPSFSNVLTKMENCIYLNWMILWGLTFYYVDEEEKQFRFNQLLNIIDKVSVHEMDIFDLIFSSLLKYGDEEMIFRLYFKIISLRLNPSWYIYNNIASKISKSEKENEKLQKIKWSSYKCEGSKPSEFRRRTLKDKNDRNILSEEVQFMANANCTECGKLIDLYTESKNFHNMIEKVNWIKCKECGKVILLKLKFHFGIEVFNPEFPGCENSSKFDEVILHSPKGIKDQLMQLMRNVTSKKSNEGHLNVETFKSEYKVLFWNNIWFFKISDLDTSFMLPYVPKPFKCLYGWDQMISDPSKKSTTNMNGAGHKRSCFYNNELIEQSVYRIEIIPYVGIFLTSGKNEDVSLSSYFNDVDTIEESAYIFNNGNKSSGKGGINANADKQRENKGIEKGKENEKDNYILNKKMVNKKAFNRILSIKNSTEDAFFEQIRKEYKMIPGNEDFTEINEENEEESNHSCHDEKNKN